MQTEKKRERRRPLVFFALDIGAFPLRPSLELLHLKFQLQPLLKHGTSTEKKFQNTETCPTSNIKDLASHKNNPLLRSVLYSLCQGFWGQFKLHSNPSKGYLHYKKCNTNLSCSRIKSQTYRAEFGLIPDRILRPVGALFFFKRV